MDRSTAVVRDALYRSCGPATSRWDGCHRLDPNELSALPSCSAGPTLPRALTTFCMRSSPPILRRPRLAPGTGSPLHLTSRRGRRSTGCARASGCSVAPPQDREWGGHFQLRRRPWGEQVGDRVGSDVIFAETGAVEGPWRDRAPRVPVRARRKGTAVTTRSTCRAVTPPPHKETPCQGLSK